MWTYDKKADTVTMPWWYWQKVYNYIVDTQAAQKIKNDYKGTRGKE